jgi:hypothetical protein
MLKIGYLVLALNAMYSVVKLPPDPKPAAVLGTQEQIRSGEDLEVKISPLRSVVGLDRTLQLRIEIWNIGTQDLLVCKDFVLGPCGLRLSFDPVAKVKHSVSSADCVPYEWIPNASQAKAEDFANTLVKDWVSIPPRHFYGATIELDPAAYPELAVVGRYRISGRYSSGGPLQEHCYYKLRAFSKQVAGLPAKSWRGAVDTNSVVIRVTARRD